MERRTGRPLQTPPSKTSQRKSLGSRLMLCWPGGLVRSWLRLAKASEIPGPLRFQSKICLHVPRKHCDAKRAFSNTNCVLFWADGKIGIAKLREKLAQGNGRQAARTPRSFKQQWRRLRSGAKYDWPWLPPWWLQPKGMPCDPLTSYCLARLHSSPMILKYTPLAWPG